MPKTKPLPAISLRAGWRDLSASWEQDGARFHIWLNHETGAPRSGIYKNPPRGTPLRGEGWFDTRHLEPGPKWAPILAAFLKSL